MRGTDCGNCSWMPYGKTNAKEPKIWVRCGGLYAFAAGLEDQVGMLVAGKPADVIILRKDAAADIRACKTLPISP